MQWNCEWFGNIGEFLRKIFVGAAISRPLLLLGFCKNALIKKCPKIHENTKMLISVAKKSVKFVEM